MCEFFDYTPLALCTSLVSLNVHSDNSVYSLFVIPSKYYSLCYSLRFVKIVNLSFELFSTCFYFMGGSGWGYCSRLAVNVVDKKMRNV